MCAPAGLALASLGQLVPPDAWSQERAAVYSIAAVAEGRRVVSTTNANFLTLEHTQLRLLMEDRHGSNFSAVRAPGLGQNGGGLRSAGTEYGEVLPPWIDRESGQEAISLRGAALLALPCRTCAALQRCCPQRVSACLGAP